MLRLRWQWKLRICRCRSPSALLSPPSLLVSLSSPPPYLPTPPNSLLLRLRPFFITASSPLSPLSCHRLRFSSHHHLADTAQLSRAAAADFSNADAAAVKLPTVEVQMLLLPLLHAALQLKRRCPAGPSHMSRSSSDFHYGLLVTCNNRVGHCSVYS